MKSLEQYGIQSPAASASLQQGGNYLPVGEFFEQAHDLLGPVGDIVQADVIPSLEEHAGRWHPSGYMVYSLGVHRDLGSLRLHIWPQNMRRSETRDVPGLPRDVHDHVLHIASVAVGGVYEDDIFKVERVGRDLTDEQVARDGLLRIFTFPDDDPSTGTLVTDGRFVRATPIEHRIVPKDDTHSIEAGTFHAPAISEDALAATLSFSSNRINLVGPHILAGGSAEPIPGRRKRVVTPEDAVAVKRQLR
jgi:hypothetical protein